MSTTLFHLTRHTIPAAHLRGLPRGVRDEHASTPLRLAINHYLPISNPDPLPGDLTLILAHGISSAKECYEPFFDDLLLYASTLSPPLRIRSIWAPDAVHNCASYALNASLLGDAVHWHDFSRDIWALINHFQSAMPPPLIGLGQSLGAGTMTLLSTWHPRLFSGIVAFEPALGPAPGIKWPLPDRYFPAVVSARRKARWASREEAARYLRKSVYYRPFDDRVFDRVVKHELRNIDDGDGGGGGGGGGVTLTTPKTLETYAWARPWPALAGTAAPKERGIDGRDTEFVPGFYRPEAAELQRTLPFVLPPVLLVWGEKSNISPAERRVWYRENVGTGPGGGGGVASGQVREAEVQGAGHPVSLEKPELCAEATGRWLAELQQTLDKERERRRDQLPFTDGFPREWLERLSKI